MASNQMEVTDTIYHHDGDRLEDDDAVLISSALNTDSKYSDLDGDSSKSSESLSGSIGSSSSSSFHSNASVNGQYSEISNSSDVGNKFGMLDFSNISELKNTSQPSDVNKFDNGQEEDANWSMNELDALIDAEPQTAYEQGLEAGEHGDIMKEQTDNVVTCTGAAKAIDNLTVELVTIPDDEDLFDFSNLPNHSHLPVNETELEGEAHQSESSELFKGELYRYLTGNLPEEDRGFSENVTPIHSVGATPLHSVGATPLHSGFVTPAESNNETGTDSESDSESSFSDDSGSYVTDSSGEEADYEAVEETIVRQVPDPIRETTPPFKPRRRRTQPPAKPAEPTKPKKSKAVVWKEKTLEKLEKFKQVTEKWLKNLEVPENLTSEDEVSLKILDLNTHLTCGLCNGYLYEASTITECMHTFCKNCIVRHCMEVSLHCPKCSILIHPTDPFVNIRLDRMIQDIVYKLLPSVAHKEMESIKAFYKEHPDAEPPGLNLSPTGSDNASVPPDEDSPNKDGRPASSSVSILLESESGDSPPLDKKYVRVAGSATIANLCNFLKSVLHLHATEQVEIYCCGDTVEEDACTLQALKEKFFTEQECLMLLQYKVRES